MIRRLCKTFYTKEFIKYSGVGIIFTLASGLLTTLTGLLLYDKAWTLLLTNVFIINGGLFLLKYWVYLKTKLIKQNG